MTASNAEPVEISTRLRPGEWTQQSLEEVTGSYQDKLRVMGSPEAEITTEVSRPNDGSAGVRFSWERGGAFTTDSQNQSQQSEDPNARGGGEDIPRGEPGEDSQELGAVLGDADRSAIDEPPASQR
ncbi:hypothetical protein [Arthrobacter livingstonensis]|uniref:hypothetical protein n=1 Tax=Arthrobacter livingstonensis TaxID=670078 RepID=UPI001B86546F|nr:hypothetical protein [Arthrobacter livingstonensis]